MCLCVHAHVCVCVSDRVSYSSGWCPTHYVAEDDFRLLVLLPPPPKLWDYRRAPPCLVYPVLEMWLAQMPQPLHLSHNGAEVGVRRIWCIPWSPPLHCPSSVPKSSDTLFENSNQKRNVAPWWDRLGVGRQLRWHNIPVYNVSQDELLMTLQRPLLSLSFPSYKELGSQTLWHHLPALHLLHS